MAGTTTALFASPFSTITTTTATTEVLHSSRSLTPSAKASFPLHNQTFFRTHNISIHRHGKFINSTSEDNQEIFGDAFFFESDDLAGNDDSDEEDETESSVDLLIRFLRSMVKKISKRAKKASRSVLPPAISFQLVSFAVDGLLLLASLSIAKALLEQQQEDASSFNAFITI
ncbi:protein SHORT HYPOCOTYL IN WHITE LIGHT 1 isoform X2 [Humulus lupulus]|uniref:protein SHORT HYPOCOTYL IN WHITE LIGHT 1 isoform X2 n=1 Tax=Humulus lupulus TaxID=3486 RepID=UPI002B405D13|nr:protein SHORT HYPOCOTYL IN WHITE LIGHT 1 isoform X2 [Humulus lupulus]